MAPPWPLRASLPLLQPRRNRVPLLCPGSASDGQENQHANRYQEVHFGSHLSPVLAGDGMGQARLWGARRFRCHNKIAAPTPTTKYAVATP